MHIRLQGKENKENIPVRENEQPKSPLLAMKDRFSRKLLNPSTAVLSRQ